MNKRELLIENLQKSLEALQEVYPLFDINSEHTKGTARRIADLWIEMCRGYDEPDFEFTTFKNTQTVSQPIIEKDIPFVTYCAHHFLPVYGKVTVAYIPNKKICGLSKIPRVVEYIASKPQIQETMTDEIAQFLADYLDPRYLIVTVEAEHTCVACRGVKSVGVKTKTRSEYGEFAIAKEAREVIKDMM